jgi:hypothetical protein
MTYTRGKELNEVTLKEAKAIHRREVYRVGRGLTYRGKGAKAMGEEYLDEVIEAEEVMEAHWDPTTMSWRRDEDSPDLPS